MSTRNRRLGDRAKKRLKVEYGVEGLELHGVSSDLSVGGLFLVAQKIFDVDTRVHLHVHAPRGSFYVEAVVVRRQLSPAHLRQIQPQGMGLRFLTPSEVVSTTMPRAMVRSDTVTLECGSADIMQKIMREQLKNGVLVVPVTEPPPAVGTVVDFQIRLSFLPDNDCISGQGKILQVLEALQPVKKHPRAVLELHDKLDLYQAIENALTYKV